MTTTSSDQRPCPGCGVLFEFNAEICQHCGHNREFDPPQFYDPRQLSVMERVMLTMLYVEDRDSKWWDRPGRLIFLAAVAFIGYVLWLAASVPP